MRLLAKCKQKVAKKEITIQWQQHSSSHDEWQNVHGRKKLNENCRLIKLDNGNEDNNNCRIVIVYHVSEQKCRKRVAADVDDSSL